MTKKEEEVATAVVHNASISTDGVSTSCLVIFYGQNLGRRHFLDQAEQTIGRSDSAKIQVDQDSVSRQHAKIVVTGEGVVLYDLGSTNGTFVNDNPCHSERLRDGDLIRIGQTIFKYISGSNIESKYHEEIYRLTTIDGLTQAYNKRYFLEALKRELAQSFRYQRTLSLVLIDIDRFKALNEIHGHLAGDYVLRNLALIVSDRLRRQDIFARYGGEEFSVILPEMDAESAYTWCEELRHAVANFRFQFADNRIAVTVSIGIRTVTESESLDIDVASALHDADTALYRAKQDGRNRTRLYGSPTSELPAAAVLGPGQVVRFVEAQTFSAGVASGKSGDRGIVAFALDEGAMRTSGILGMDQLWSALRQIVFEQLDSRDLCTDWNNRIAVAPQSASARAIEAAVRSSWDARAIVPQASAASSASFSPQPMDNETTSELVLVPRPALHSAVMSPEEVGEAPSRVLDLILARISDARKSAKNEEDVAAVLDRPESDHLERKSSIRWDREKRCYSKEVTDNVFKTVAAFANSDGGDLVIGVSDSGERIGLEADGFSSDDEMIRFVVDILNRCIGTTYVSLLKLTPLHSDGRRFLVVTCARSKEPVFFSPRARSGKYFYVRQGTVTRALEDPEELMKYTNERFRN